VTAQAPELRERKNGITPFDCPRSNWSTLGCSRTETTWPARCRPAETCWSRTPIRPLADTRQVISVGPTVSGWRGWIVGTGVAAAVGRWKRLAGTAMAMAWWGRWVCRRSPRHLAPAESGRGSRKRRPVSSSARRIFQTAPASWIPALRAHFLQAHRWVRNRLAPPPSSTVDHGPSYHSSPSRPADPQTGTCAGRHGCGRKTTHTAALQ
jgi:hypothetical protein